MTIKKYSKNIKGTGNTFRKCISCKGYHTNKKQCPSPNNYQGKISCSVPNFSKYRHLEYIVSGTPEIYDKYCNMYYKSNGLKKMRYTRRKKLQNKDDFILTLPLTKKKPCSTIKCHICITEKGNYQTLGCNHSICTECYKNILQTTSLKDKCPFCRTDMFSENQASYVLINENPRNNRKYILVDSNDIDFDFDIDFDD